MARKERPMLRQDYVMRLISEMVRTLLRLIFQIDMNSPAADLLENDEEQETLQRLLRLIDNGEINEAENQIYQMTEDVQQKELKLALIFYAYLNEKSDEYLEQHNFSREEIKFGLKNIMERYEIHGFEEMF